MSDSNNSDSRKMTVTVTFVIMTVVIVTIVTVVIVTEVTVEIVTEVTVVIVTVVIVTVVIFTSISKNNLTPRHQYAVFRADFTILQCFCLNYPLYE